MIAQQYANYVVGATNRTTGAAILLGEPGQSLNGMQIIKFCQRQGFAIQIKTYRHFALIAVMMMLVLLKTAT